MNDVKLSWLNQLEEELAFLCPECHSGVESGNIFSPNPRYIVSLKLELESKDEGYSTLAVNMINNQTYQYWFKKEHEEHCEKAYKMLNALVQHAEV